MTDTTVPAPASLSISLVLFHSDLALLRALLDSLACALDVAIKAGELGHASVALVDNSCDETYHNELQGIVKATSLGTSLQVTASTRNAGFGAAHNGVINNACSDYHLVLNPDVVLNLDTLHAGMNALRSDPAIQLVSPYVESPGGEQEFLCKRYPSVWVLFLRAFAPAFVRRRFARAMESYECRDICVTEAPVDVELASGCFMLARTATVQKIGGFDEAFFLYFEDFDLSLRLATLGRLVYLPAMRIVHHGGYAASKGLRHIRLFIAGGLKFFNRHGWRWI